MTFCPTTPAWAMVCVCVSQDSPPGESASLHADSPHLSIILGCGGGHWREKKAIFLSLWCLEMSKLLLPTAYTHNFPCYTGGEGSPRPQWASVCRLGRDHFLCLHASSIGWQSQNFFFSFLHVYVLYTYVKSWRQSLHWCVPILFIPLF